MKLNIWHRKFREVNEKITYFEFTGKDKEFRKKFNIPSTGFKNDWKKRNIWYVKLTKSKRQFENFKALIKKMGDWLELVEEDELASLKEYLIMGGFPVIFALNNSRTKIEFSKKSGGEQVWLNVTGLSKEQFLEEFEKIKLRFPELINNKVKWKPTRQWENVITHHKIMELKNQGKSANKIADEMTEDRYKSTELMPESIKKEYLDKELDVSVETVKQTVKRYKKRVEKFFKKKGQITFNL